MREIDLRRVSTVRGFSSAIGSFRHNRSSPLYLKLKELSAAIQGGRVEEGTWNDDSLAIRLDRNRGLLIRAMNDGTVFPEVITGDQYKHFERSWPREIQPVRVTRFGTEGSATSEFDRHSILERMIGAHVRCLVHDEFGTYVYLQGTTRYLCLYAKIILQSGTLFLDWFEDED